MALVCLFLLPAPPAAAEVLIGNVVGVGGPAHEAVLDGARGVAYVSVPSTKDMVTVGLADGAIVSRTPFTAPPRGMALSRDGDTLFLALEGTGEVAALSLDTGQTTIYGTAGKMFDDRTWEVVEARPGEIWVAPNPYNDMSASMVRIDLSSGLVSTVETGVQDQPHMTVEGNSLYVTHEHVDKFTASPPKLIARGGHLPGGGDRLVVSPDGDELVTSSGSRRSAATMQFIGEYDDAHGNIAGSKFAQFSADGEQVFLARDGEAEHSSPIVEVFARHTQQWLDTWRTTCRSQGTNEGLTDFDRIGAEDRFLLSGTWGVCVTGPPAPLPTCNGQEATVVGTPGDDTLHGTAGTETSRANDVIVGLGGNDIIDGGFGDDVVCGGDGDDIVSGRIESDALFGGAGIDTVTYDDGSSAILVHLPTSTVTARYDEGQEPYFDHWVGDDTIDSFEVIVGSNGGDLFVGDGWSNVFLGKGGADVLVGGGGDDTLDGGDGLDRVEYVSSPGPVTVDLEANDASGHGDDTLVSIENAVGSRFADSLAGSAQSNVLTGRAGHDALSGGLGADVLIGGVGNDELSAGEDNDVLIGDNGNDVMDGGAGDDRLVPGGDDDAAAGGEGSDTLDFGTATAGVRADLAEGSVRGQGIDTVSGFENVLGSQFADRLFGDAGAQFMTGAAGNDLLYGRQGNDSLAGDWGDDTIYGRSGDDYLYGQHGNDVLGGGVGIDWLDGGDGTDSCRAGEQVHACE